MFGDGTSDRDDPAPLRDIAVSAGITINGLVIFSEEHDLGALAHVELRRHFETSVIGGIGSFLIEAEDFPAFETAIRIKLIREIAGSVFSKHDQSEQRVRIAKNSPLPGLRPCAVRVYDFQNPPPKNPTCP